MFPTDAKLLHRAREKLVALARKTGLDLRQSYTRVGKFALIKHQRYAHAKQFKRAGKALRKLRTYLGRTIRDIGRQITDDEQLQDIFRHPLHLAGRVLNQKQKQVAKKSLPSTRSKVYSLHARKLNALAKARLTRLMSLASKSLLPPRCIAQRAACLLSMPRHCQVTRMTAIRSPR